MGRPAGVSGADTLAAIRKAAIARIDRFGYEAMNLRDLAADVNIRVGSLYNHVPNKQEFLAGLLEDIMRELLADLDQQMAGLSDPEQCLLQFVRFHIAWHTARRAEVFIGNSELRSLSAPQYARVIALRRRYETYLRNLLLRGRKAGVWQFEDARVTTYALLAMLTGIAHWYRPDGRLSQARLIRLYEQMVQRLLKPGGTCSGSPRA